MNKDISDQTPTPVDATSAALALIVHSLSEQLDAKQLLQTLMANYDRASKSPKAEGFDQLMISVLKAASDAALKQNPQDPETLEIYQGLRPGDRH